MLLSTEPCELSTGSDQAIRCIAEALESDRPGKVSHIYELIGASTIVVELYLDGEGTLVRREDTDGTVSVELGRIRNGFDAEACLSEEIPNDRLECLFSAFEKDPAPLCYAD